MTTAFIIIELILTIIVVAFFNTEDEVLDGLEHLNDSLYFLYFFLWRLSPFPIFRPMGILFFDVINERVPLDL